MTASPSSQQLWNWPLCLTVLISTAQAASSEGITVSSVHNLRSQSLPVRSVLMAWWWQSLAALLAILHLAHCVNLTKRFLSSWVIFALPPPLIVTSPSFLSLPLLLLFFSLSLSLSLFYSFTLLLSCPCLLHLTETGWLHRCTMDAITLISLNKQFSSHLTKVTRVTLNFNFIHTIKNRLWQMRSHSKKKNFFNWWLKRLGYLGVWKSSWTPTGTGWIK